ncbi:hypothetical protein [Fusobacterium russii]|uniref:hypothetical protein n=1 Tax=Fusobacterium russii TaxID=854 RepID=UPI0003A4ECA3|nr:hypothetical protein [Fusobacterium russii]
MHPAIAFFVLMSFLALGEFISVKTRAIVPSILVFLILLLASVWGGLLPTNVIDLAGFSEALTDVIMVVIVVNMGSSLSLDSLKKEWKTVLIGIGAIIGIAGIILPIGSMIYDWQTAVVAAPPIAGGFVAAFEMSRTSLAKGLPHLSTIALLLLALQEFPVYFLLPGLLRFETLRRLDLFRKGELKAVAAEEEKQKKRLIPAIPEKYLDTSTYLFLLGLVGTFAILTSMLSGIIFNSFGIAFKISPTIFALFYGIIGGEIGLLERKSLQKANTFGFFVVASVVGVMGGLVNSSVEEILSLIIPLIVLIALGIVGMAIGGIIVGKVLKVNWQMSFAIALNCLIGFPVNFLLTNEAIHVLAKTEEEKDFLSNTLVPTMLVGGFTTVTLGSVVFAGILANFL